MEHSLNSEKGAHIEVKRLAGATPSGEFNQQDRVGERDRIREIEMPALGDDAERMDRRLELVEQLGSIRVVG